MKECPSCHNANEESAVFCAICGAVLPKDEPQEQPVSDVSEQAPQAQPSYEAQAVPQTEQQPAYEAQQPRPTFVQPVTPPVYAQPNYSQSYGYPQFNENMLPPEYRPVSIGQFFGYTLLFSVPVVGFIMLLVTAFGSGNSISLKNYAKSMLIWYVIGIVLTVIMFVFGFMLAASTGEMYY